MATIAKTLVATAKVAEPTLAAMVPKPMDDHALSARISIVAQLAYDKLSRDVVDATNLRRLVCHANLLDGLMARHPQVVGDLYDDQQAAGHYVSAHSAPTKQVTVLETILEENLTVNSDGEKPFVLQAISAKSDSESRAPHQAAFTTVAAEKDSCSTLASALPSTFVGETVADKTWQSFNAFTLAPRGFKAEQRLCAYFADLFKESWHDDDESEEDT
jgi:hypothetical protein